MMSKDRRLPLGEQRFRLASFNRPALLQIGIAFFFMTVNERERDSDMKKKKREREKEVQRWVGSAAIISKCRERGRE